MVSLARFATTWPKLALTVVLLATAVAAAGLPRATSEVGYRVFLGADHPEVVKLVEVIDTYGGGLPIRIVWDCSETPRCDSVFDHSALEMAARLVTQLTSVNSVRGALSPATAPLIVPLASGFDIRTLVEEGVVVSDVDVLTPIARRDPRWIGELVSADGLVGSIVVQMSAMDSDATSSVVERVLAATSEFSDVPFYLVGDPIDFVVAGGEMQRETARIMPIMIGLIVGIIFFLWRSPAAAVLSLGIAGIGVAWGMGVMAWLGWPQMELTQALPPLILVIGTCNALHLLSAVQRESTVMPRISRIMSGSERVAAPCLVTTATTVIGFLSFASSGIESFVRFGIISTLGILAAFVAAFTVLPALLRLLPDSALDGGGATSDRWASSLAALSDLVEKRSTTILSVGVAVTVVAFFGATRLEIDVDEQKMLGEGSLVVGWANAVEEKLRRADSFEVSISMPPDVLLESPETVEVVEAILLGLSKLPETGRGESYVSLLAQMNHAVHEGDDEYRRVGSTTAENAELLTLLQMGATAQLDSWASPSGGRIRLSIPTSPSSRDRTTRLLADVDRVVSAEIPAGATFIVTGPVAIYNSFVDEIHKTQLRSFASAGAAIALALFASFLASRHGLVRTVVWSSAAFTVSLLPVVATLGLMGGAGVPLDVGTIMVGAIVLGIAVDDSIHWIYSYAEARRDGVDAVAAARSATLTTGRALVTTTAALSVGFLTLMLSSWQSISAFGGLSAVAIVSALIADLLLLPSVFLVAHRSVNGRPNRPMPSKEAA